MSALLHSLKLGTLALGLICAGCSKRASPSAAEPQSKFDGVPTPEFAETLPKVRGVGGYVGSESCRDCHKEQFSTWHRTYHRTMTQIASRASVQADFNNVILTNDSTRFTLTSKGDEYWAHMEHIGAPSPDTSVSSEGLDVRIGLITGSHHMQVFWVPEGHGNLQIGFPFTWLIPEKRWVPRNSTFIRPPETEHRPEPWNIVCSRCHTTGVEPRFVASERSVDTHVGELGISCEACHGPGQRHVELRRTAAQAGGENTLQADEIVHPAEMDPRRSAQICGFCHSMKWIDKTEHWRESGFQYRPGDDLERSTPIIRASTIDTIAGLQEYLQRNPSLLPDFFWSDGMIRVSGREYNGLLDSPCNKGGKFTCISCHSGHKSEPDDLLSERARSNESCLQCHPGYKAAQELLRHTHHDPVSTGSQCYNCHMPHTTYGVLKAIRSHQVSSPRVADDLSTGRPNACNLCHLDQTLAWTAGNLKKWFKQEIPPLPATATNLSHAVRLAMAGDAGQRVLMAWHFGWEPAQKISGTNWITPILGQLLDDPYAAVRLVAERALRSLGEQPPAAYDYTAPVEAREPVREQVWKRWLATPRNIDPKRQTTVLANASEVHEQRVLFDELLARRDRSNVRLRE